MSKVVLITGCSSGIGHATAIEFALKGYKVIAGARRLERMKDLEHYGVKIISLDVTSQLDVEELKKLIENEYYGKLDILYNNAGQGCTEPGIEASDELVRQCYEANVFGPIRLVRELIPYLIKTRGAIGFTGSIASFIDFPFGSIYASTKAALRSYASILGIELEPFGIKVLDFLTGVVDTEIFDKRRPFNKNSLYYVDGMEDSLATRESSMKSNPPISAEYFAKQIVKDFENLKIGRVEYYRGTLATVMSFFQYLPRFFKTKLVLKKLALDVVFANIRKIYNS